VASGNGLADYILGGSFDYLTLAGYKKNLYLEIAVPAKESDTTADDSLFWERDDVKTILMAYHKIGLGACEGLPGK
jgi:hypothetical protein